MPSVRIRKLLISKIAAIGGGGGGGGSYSTTTTAEVVQNVTTPGSIASGKAWWRITNIGPAVATVQGASLDIGGVVGTSAYADPAALQFKRSPAITYDPGTSGNLLIEYKD